MSDIFVMVRSQSNNALTSIDGIPFVAFLYQSEQVVAKETIELVHADAGFDDLSPGHYTVVVKHERVEPSYATYDVPIHHDDEVILITFVYLEAERVLLRIQSAVEKRL